MTAAGHFRAVKLESSVQNPYGQLGILVFDDARYLYFRRADHHDIDILGRQGAKHAGRYAGVALHADSDNRDFGDPAFQGHVFGSELRQAPASDGQRLLSVGTRHRERNICQTVLTGILNDHVDHDAGLCDASEQATGDARPVRQPRQGNFGLAAVRRDASYDHAFHILIRSGDQCPASFTK